MESSKVIALATRFVQKSCVRICVVTLASTAALAGCSCSTRGSPVTAVNKEAPGVNDGQSETALTTGIADQGPTVIAAYNDDTGTSSTIVYDQPQNTRKLLPGASEMGWSYSLDRGTSWTYGGKVKGDDTWPVIWSDPAATTSQKNPHDVFLAYLAVPAEKMPSNGPIEGYVGTYLGGACIFRSTDGGLHFKRYQCIRNQDTTGPNGQQLPAGSENGHFYDGGSMASSPKGQLYVAYIDMDTQQAEIWSSPDENGQFKKMPTPFPQMWVASHPIIRVNQSNGDLYAAAPILTGTGDMTIYLNRFDGSQWGTPVQASDAGVQYENITFSTGYVMRIGRPYSYDIGASSSKDAADGVRMEYVLKDSATGRLYLNAAGCKWNLQPMCYPQPGWGTGGATNPKYTVDQFNPNVRAWPGGSGWQPEWQVSYLERDGITPNSVTLREGGIGYIGSNPAFLAFNSMGPVAICPDNRGYWGDYDDMLVAGVDPSSHAPTYVRTMSDSSAGCVLRTDWHVDYVHVRAAGF